MRDKLQVGFREYGRAVIGTGEEEGSQSVNRRRKARQCGSVGKMQGLLGG